MKTGDYLMRIGEAIVLAVFFKIAADNTDSLLIELVSLIAHCVVGLYAGVPIGIIFARLEKFRTKKLWVALAVTLPLAVGWAWGALQIGRHISEVVKQMAVLGS